MLSATLITLAISAAQAPTPPAVMDRSVVPHCAISTDWRSEPACINGAPVVRPVMVPVKFKQ